jgi:hypothetical protein
MTTPHVPCFVRLTIAIIKRSAPPAQQDFERAAASRLLKRHRPTQAFKALWGEREPESSGTLLERLRTLPSL